MYWEQQLLPSARSVYAAICKLETEPPGGADPIRPGDIVYATQDALCAAAGIGSCTTLRTACRQLADHGLICWGTVKQESVPAATPRSGACSLYRAHPATLSCTAELTTKTYKSRKPLSVPRPCRGPHPEGLDKQSMRVNNMHPDASRLDKCGRPPPRHSPSPIAPQKG